MTTAIADRSRRSAKARRAPAPRRRHGAAKEARIIFATAGEPESRGALEIASALAARDHSAVLVLGVATPFPHNLSTFISMRQPVAIDEQSRRHVLENVRRSLRNVRGAEEWETRAFLGLPPDEIQLVAQRWGASLILLGLGRHKRVDRIFGTETAIAVMRHARLPVLAVSANASGLPKRAVAAVDFTPASIRAAAFAATLLADDGTLILAHACAFRGVNAKPGDLIDIYRTGARAKLDDAVRTIKRKTDCAVESVMLEGEPAKVLIDYARDKRCDLIALGGHEMGLADRILLGSIRTHVMRDAPCSVLIAPPERSKAARQ